MLTRRELLRRGASLGVAGGGASSLAAPTLLWQARVADGGAAGASASAPADRTLIIVQLAGGNDDLNMVVPYTDGTYLSSRPTLRVEPSTAIRLDDRLGLNPVMGNLKRIWDKKQLALIEGVGYPDPQYSHFDAMTIWQTAAPKGEFNDGWLGRYFKETGAQTNSAFAGLDIGGSVAPMLQANGVMLPTLQNPATYKMALDPRDATERLEAWKDLQEAGRARNKYLSLIGSASLGARESTEALGRAVGSYEPAVTYGRDSLSTSLRLLATIIVNQPGTKVAYTMVGGFDSHSFQRQSQDTLLEILSDAFSNFQTDLSAHGKAQDVLLVTWSEFGRRVKENGSQGTDHGDGGAMLAMGGSVKGGIYGEAPDLRTLDSNGSQRWTTDFRSVYATMLEEWLGVDSSTILGDRFEHVPFVSA
ncbi:MAG TPA: DUF1501 domain-containing protein [Dehalococcoidia bacterium]|nr:DUF1501 domain-containing protein [Dehalococcoidia bacterium]